MEDIENPAQSLLEKKSKNFSTIAESNPANSILPEIQKIEEEDFLENQDDTHIYSLPNVEGITKRVQYKLLTVSVVCTILMIAEIVGGLLAGSLAIMTDAAHLFSDLSGFFISIFSLWLAKKPSTKKLTYGYHRAEVIGALGSIILIWGLTIWLFSEAIQRLINRDFEIDRYFMLGTSIFGLLCNLLMGKILHSGGHHHGHSHGHDHGNDHGHEHEHEKEHEHDHKKKEHGHDHKEKKNKKDKKEKKNKSNKTQEITQIQENPEEDHSHEKSHKHDHDHEHDHEEHKHEEHEDHDHKNQHDDHSHSHDNEKDHDHEHEKEDNHEHEHHDHDHDHDKKDKSTKNIKKGNLSHISDHDNYNLRAAMIHIIGDTVQSVGVIIAALIIFFDKDLKLADPICTFIFAILVIFTTVPVVKDCMRVLMEGTPVGIVINEFEEKLNNIVGVKEVHDLHVWSLSVGKPAMSAHIFSDSPSESLREATILCRKYGIYHSTLQVENWNERHMDNFIKCDHNIH